MNETPEADIVTTISEDPIAESLTAIIQNLGEDPTRQGLEKTPKRAANALRYLTQGYHQSLDEIVNDAIFDTEMDEMVLVKDIELYSMCEHHLLPFIGKCHIAYLPRGKIVGLSKLARITDMFARRLQVQERLTQQIGDTVQQITDAKGVGVIIEAQHLCMMMRGVAKQNSVMKTSMLTGRFRNDSRTRSEFFHLVQS